MTRFRRVASAIALSALSAMLGACMGRPSETPRAHGDVATLLVLPERGAAAVAVDASHVFLATWHGVVRASHTGSDASTLYDAPLGGVSPTLIASDAGRVYVVEARPCEGDVAYAAGGAHVPDCARVLAVPKDGGSTRVLAAMNPGPPPRAIAADGGYVYIADKRRILRVPSGGGSVEIAALAEDDVEDVGALHGRVLWIEADSYANPPDGRLVTRDEAGTRRVLGRADAARGPLVFFDRWVYWIGGEKVWRADVRGGAVESLGEARARVGEAHLAVDAIGVAWTEPQGARLALRPSGGAVVRVTLPGETPTSVGVDGPFAFVATIHEASGATRLLRITR